jgi:hypothetical protein
MAKPNSAPDTAGTSEPAGLPVSCQCGAVNIRTPLPQPLGMAYCHCTDCRKASGSAFGTSAYFPASTFFPLPPELEEKLTKWTRPTDSGNTNHKHFCKTCGDNVFNAVYLPDGSLRPFFAIKGGCVEGLDWTRVKHIWTKSAVMPLQAEWEKYETTPPTLIKKD